MKITQAMWLYAFGTVLWEEYGRVWRSRLQKPWTTVSRVEQTILMGNRKIRMLRENVNSGGQAHEVSKGNKNSINERQSQNGHSAHSSCPRLEVEME